VSDGFLQKLRREWQAEFFSPKDFLRRIFVVVLIFSMAHLAGWREFTSVLNGTAGSMELSCEVTAGLGGAYILIYLALVLLVPTFLLAAAILIGWHKLFRPDSEKTR